MALCEETMLEDAISRGTIEPSMQHPFLWKTSMWHYFLSVFTVTDTLDLTSNYIFFVRQSEPVVCLLFKCAVPLTLSD